MEKGGFTEAQMIGVLREQGPKPGDAELHGRLRVLAAGRRRFGYRRLGMLLRREGVAMNKRKASWCKDGHAGSCASTPGMISRQFSIVNYIKRCVLAFIMH